jgi:SAM-dependent methyltransferase
MSSSERQRLLQREWEERERKLGCTERAVLFKRFPAVLNHVIHRWHVGFIKQSLGSDPRSLLDIGCGYGRIAAEIYSTRPNIAIEGVELCPGFAAEFERTIGPCTTGPIQEFETNRQYDVILAVTLLMYLEREDLPGLASKLWNWLAPGGRIVCIEPAIEFLRLWRTITGTASASPTGGSVLHFTTGELAEPFLQQPGARLLRCRSLSLVPWLKATALHHAIVVQKRRQGV